MKLKESTNILFSVFDSNTYYLCSQCLRSLLHIHKHNLDCFQDMCPHSGMDWSYRHQTFQGHLKNISKGLMNTYQERYISVAQKRILEHLLSIKYRNWSLSIKPYMTSGLITFGTTYLSQYPPNQSHLAGLMCLNLLLTKQFHLSKQYNTQLYFVRWMAI